VAEKVLLVALALRLDARAPGQACASARRRLYTLRDAEHGHAAGVTALARSRTRRGGVGAAARRGRRALAGPVARAPGASTAGGREFRWVVAARAARSCTCRPTATRCRRHRGDQPAEDARPPRPAGRARAALAAGRREAPHAARVHRVGPLYDYDGIVGLCQLAGSPELCRLE
jgi:hypothetical protein